MREQQRAVALELLVAIGLAAASVVFLVGLGLAELDLIKAATGKTGVSTTISEDLSEGERDLSDVISAVTDSVTVAGFLLIPLAATGAGIAWLFGSPKGPRYFLTVVVAGLTIGSANLIVA